jgi:amino acid adenylation domain-containing protein
MKGTHNIEDIYPLSSLQEGILFHSLYSPSEGLYVDHIVCDLRAAEKMDPGVLRKAFQMVVDRHQALRTAFVWKLESRPQQIVLRKVSIPLTEHQYAELTPDERACRIAEFLQRDRSQGFNPSKPPLFRLDLFHCGPGFAKLVFSYYHIIMDAWSVPIVFREVQTFYQALLHGDITQMEQPRPFRDYIIWQQQRDLASAEAFWRKELKGISTATILFSERGSGKDTGAGNEYAHADMDMTFQASEELRLAAKRHALTMNTVIQGAWAFLLGRCAGSDDVLFGTVVSGRPYTLKGVEAMVGLFTNSLPTRVRMAPHLKTGEWLQELQRKQFELHEYEWSPLAKVQEWSEFERQAAFFESVVIFQNIPLSSSGSGHSQHALEISVAHHDPKNNFPLTLMVIPGSRLLLRLLYDTRRFSGDTIKCNLERLVALLERIPATFSQPLHALSSLTDKEQCEILNEGHPVGFPSRGFIHELIERHTREAPDAIAAVCKDNHLSYAELNDRSDTLATILQSQCALEEIIVVAAERGFSFLIAMLAVFKAGCAYLPVDPRHPASRIAQILRLSGSSLVLAGEDLARRLEEICRDPGHAVNATVLDLDAEIMRRPGRESQPRPSSEHSLAYVIYTSGSTGVPKGAMIEHGGMLNHLYAKVIDLGLDSSHVVAQTASQCFDISVWQFLASLLVGGRVEIFPDEITHNPVLMLKEIRVKKISILEIVPSMLRALLEEGQYGNSKERPLAGLSFLVVTGEELPFTLVKDWFRNYPDVPLVNAYGPTECSDDITHHFMYEAPQDSELIPIGRCVANMRLYVLDSWLEPAPRGVMGELFVGGAGVGRGYLHDPARTAELFLPDPFDRSGGGRLYRTGDLVCRRADGSFDFYGRIDSQLKIRGHRIELGEIETVLSAHPGVKQAIVLATKVDEQAGALKLSAYIVPAPGYQAEKEEESTYQWERTEQWKTVFDEVYGQKKTSDADQALHLRVWINTYTDQSFHEEEIFECVEDSVARLKSLQPKRVLELGCGTGLLLFRLAPFCEQYWGTDISSRALAEIEKRRQEAGTCDLRLFERAAHDFSGIPRNRFDLIILNEIVQYFPDGEYLFRVMREAIAAVRPGGFIFVGGVRNLHLLNAFHTSIELSRAPADLPLQQLRARVHLRSDNEKELLVAPEFFTTLREQLLHIGSVRVVLKGGKCRNEFTKFRYDTILRVQLGPHAKCEFPVVSWKETGETPGLITQWVLEKKIPRIVITGIPNARVAEDVHACHLLKHPNLDTVQELSNAIADSVQDKLSLDPEQVRDFMQERGFCVEVSWASSDTDGAYDLFLAQNEEQLWEMADSFSRKAGTAPARAITNILRRHMPSANLGHELRKYLQQHLPEYMVPADFSVLPAWPLTANGKIDRQALSRMETSAPIKDTPDAVPPTPTEEMIMAIWAGVLGTRVSRCSNFFDLGGHSLLATQVMSRLKRAFQIEVPLRTLFDASTVVEFSRVIDAMVRESTGMMAPAIVRAPAEERRVLSFAQQRLWIMNQLEPNSPAYNLPNAVGVDGPLQIEALKAALNETIRRHESLRTSFVVVAEEPQQVIAERFHLQPRLVDLSGLTSEQRETQIMRLAMEEGSRPFQIHTGPLLRVHILRTGSNSHVVLFTMHHIISDAWSAGILITELAALYDAFSRGVPTPLQELPVQYADFSLWQRRWMQGDVLEKQLAYWKEQLAGAPTALNLPITLPRPLALGPAGRHHTFLLSPVVSTQLQEITRKESATLFMATLAAFQTLLYRLTGQKDIVVGTDIANRNQAATERLIGFFVNLLVLRTRFSPGLTFRKLLGRVKEIAMDAFAHQDLPFDVLTRELRQDRSLGSSSLFDVLFVFQNAPIRATTASHIRISPLGFDYKTARFDLALFMEETSQGLAGKWVYRTDLFSFAAISRLSNQFEALLACCAAFPDTLVEEFPMAIKEQLEHEVQSKLTLKKLKDIRPKAVSLSN